MTVDAFTQLQSYDTQIQIGLQSAFGAAQSSRSSVMCRFFAVIPSAIEVVARGTSNYRGMVSGQRTKGQRFVAMFMSVDIMNNAVADTLVEWCMGSGSTFANAPKFATVEVGYTGQIGGTFENVAVDDWRLVMDQGEVASLEIQALVLADWDLTASTAAIAAPAMGTPVRIDDLTFTRNGVNYAVEAAFVRSRQPVLPVFANNAYPVSYEVPNSRDVEVGLIIPPSSTSRALYDDLKDDSSSNMTISASVGTLSATLRNCVVRELDGHDFEDDLVTGGEVGFRVTATDNSTPEMTLTI